MHILVTLYTLRHNTTLCTTSMYTSIIANVQCTHYIIITVHNQEYVHCIQCSIHCFFHSAVYMQLITLYKLYSVLCTCVLSVHTCTRKDSFFFTYVFYCLPMLLLNLVSGPTTVPTTSNISLWSFSNKKGQVKVFFSSPLQFLSPPFSRKRSYSLSYIFFLNICLLLQP